MTDHDLAQQLEQARQTIQALQDELAQTNREVLALTLELEQRVDERTAALRAAHEELERTNSELLQLTLELEERVAQRTQELQSMTQQLWQAAKLATVGELGASIAHELNNPLTTVSLRIETLLAQTEAADPRRQALLVVEQEVERMADLVAHLLDFSRRSHPQISTVDIRVEIDNTLELINHHLRKRKVQVVRDYAQDVPQVRADRQQMRQVFLNLFTNASDAMPQGGTLTIRVRAAADGPNERLLVEIEDNGSGIAPEDLPRIFEPFFTTKPEGQGTGLGLPICRRIIDEHRGSLQVQSRPGEGTTVRITLPVNNGITRIPAQ